MIRKPCVLAIALAATVACPLVLRADDPPRYAGPTDNGFRLPNGWTVTPAGQQVPLTDLPLNIVPLG